MKRQPPHPSHRPFRSVAGLALCAATFALITACSSGDKETDLNSVVPKMMKDLTGPRPEEAAAHLFDVTSPDERRDAIAFLCKQKYGHEPPYIKAYTMLATDPHPMVRAQAMKALGSARNPGVVPALLKGLDDKDAMVRADAAAGLVESFTDEAIDPLMTHLKEDTDVQTRMNAACALGNSASPKAIRALIDALDDRNVGVTHYALKTLVHVTGQNIAMESRQWLQWYQSQPWAKSATQG